MLTENLGVNAPADTVFTIGHSNHAADAFVALLRRHGVALVIDVRSAPYSRYLPHFNKELLAEALRKAGIRYAFRGKELGGQPSDRAYYDDEGRVLYREVSRTPAYGEAIEFVADSSGERQVALMCSEKEPLDCHRTLMISQTLAERGLAVAHIHADGSLENHAEAMNRLLDDFKLPHHGDLFRSREEVIADAVARQARKVGARWSESSGGAGWEGAQ